MQYRPITDMLLCVDAENSLKYHSRKMMCKLRDIFDDGVNNDHLYAFYREFPPQQYTQ